MRDRLIRTLVAGWVLALGVAAVWVAHAEDLRDPAATPRAAIAADWPCWRGPTHDGHAPPGQSVPLSWSATENVLWSADIPGRGNGSPTVVGSRIYLATCDEGSGGQSLLAFDRSSGRRIWQTTIHESGAMRKHERSTGASVTPACDGERLFVAFANGNAVIATALTRDGERLWQKKVCDYQIHQGYGASPLVHGDFVIVAADQPGGGALVAYDRATGAEAWRRERPRNPSYSSPVVYRLCDRDQLILIGNDRVVSHDPRTGAVIWEWQGGTTECVTTTVSDGTRVFSTGGYPRNHVAAIRGDGSARLDWENDQRVYVPSMVCRDGHLYGVLDAGIATCWDSATGAEKWKKRLGGNFSASLVLLDDMVFATSETGITTVFRASPAGFEHLGGGTLGDEAFASPAVCGGRIYFRIAEQVEGTRRERLVCIGAGTPPR
jgi:hypothetical protein